MTQPILKYPGAKWALAPQIVAMLPAHTHYIEPFFGSGAIFFNKQPSAHEVVNDLDDDVINLMRVVRERGEELAHALEFTPYARNEYYASYERVDDPLERARRFMVRAWQAHGFKLYCRTGWRHNGSQSLQPVTRLWKTVPDRIRAVIERLRDAEIESMPALEIIQRYNTADTLLYVDPPYILDTRNKRKIYRHEMTDNDHHALLDILDAHTGMVVLSGYASTLYDDRLTSWHRIEMAGRAEKGQSRTEVLWLNKAAAKTKQLSLLEMTHNDPL